MKCMCSFVTVLFHIQVLLSYTKQMSDIFYQLYIKAEESLLRMVSFRSGQKSSDSIFISPAVNLQNTHIHP
jgi:hypothetical protein